MKKTHMVWGSVLSTYRKHTKVSSLLLVVLFVLLANFAYIFITNPDPLISRSHLPVQRGGVFMNLPFDGGNSIEGNDGITKQSLGMQAAHQILHGQLPLWNYYEGVGAPLLGETQSAALSPFTLLLLLPHGFLINELVLEMIAGAGMYLFLRRIRDSLEREVNNVVAVTGGCLYATLGTFMMLPNACFNPIAFLPWSMLGVSLIFSGSQKILGRKNINAMIVFALSVVLSINAGFPEIAFINTLLVLIYAVILFVKTKRREKVARLVSLAIPGVVAILLSLPWIIEFLTYINPANGSAGAHGSIILRGLGDGGSAYLSSFIPNVIGYAATSNPVFGDIGGFFTISCVVLALVAISSKSIKLWHKLLFGGWFIVGWMRVLGVAQVSTVIAHIPMLGSAAVYRYIPVSMSFCLIVLACFGVNKIALNEKEESRRVLVVIACFTALLYGFLLYNGQHPLKSFILASPKHAIFATLFLELSVAASGSVLVAMFVRWKYKKQFICMVIALESLLCFSVWQFGAYSKAATVDTTGVQFLQQNLGTQRFDSNLLNPNYGSYFNISQISMADLPIPRLWGDYINKNIEAYIPSIGYLSNKFDATRIAQDKSLGVKYLYVIKGSLDSDVVKQQHLSLVNGDENSEIFELPGYRPYMSGPNCFVVSSDGLNKLVVSCKQASQLTRLELFYPGWHAKIDGKKADITNTDKLFQRINVPKGKHSIVFYYWPKYMTLALVGAALGGGIVISGAVYVAINSITEKKYAKASNKPNKK